MLKQVKSLPADLSPVVTEEELVEITTNSKNPEFLEFARLMTHADFPRFWEIELNSKQSIKILDSSGQIDNKKKFNASCKSRLFIDVLLGCFCFYDFSVKRANRFQELPYYLSGVLETIDHWSFFSLSNFLSDWVYIREADRVAHRIMRADSEFDEHYARWVRFILEDREKGKEQNEGIAEFAHWTALNAVRAINSVMERAEELVTGGNFDEKENYYQLVCEGFPSSDIAPYDLHDSDSIPNANYVSVAFTTEILINELISKEFLNHVDDFKTIELPAFKASFAELLISLVEKERQKEFENLLSIL